MRADCLSAEGGKKTEKLLAGEQRRRLGQAKGDLSGCALPGFNSDAGPKNGSCLLCCVPSASDESLQRRMTANQRSSAGLGSAHELLLQSHVGPCVAGAVLVAKHQVYEQEMPPRFAAKTSLGARDSVTSKCCSPF